MIGTIAVISANLLVAALARKREMGFTKALLFSILLTPFLALPLVLRSRRLPPKPKAGGSRPSEVKPPVNPEQNPYGYKEGGKILSDSYILSNQWSCSVSNPDSLRVPREQQRQVSPAEERRTPNSRHL